MVKAFDIANIVLHVILISAFLGTYFFTFGAYLEKKILKNQIDYLMDDLLGSVKLFMPQLSAEVKNEIQNYQPKIDKSSDDDVEKKNKDTLMKAVKVILTGFVIGIVIIFAISKKFDTEGLSTKDFFIKLFKHNMVTLLFVALTELVFALGFAQDFMSLDMNKLKKTMIDTLIQIKTNVV